MFVISVLDGNKCNIFLERLKNLHTVIMKKLRKEFSEFISIPQPTLPAYESGRNKSNIDVIINIADKCNISVDWLIMIILWTIMMLKKTID